jgi:hypothetical protein
MLEALARLFFAKRIKVTDAQEWLQVVVDPKTSASYFEYEGKKVKLFALEE